METRVKFEGHGTELVDCVASLFDVNKVRSKFSDVQVKVGQQTFYCHKLILQLNSVHFAQLSFTAGTPVILKNIDPDQFYNVLEFMYTGEILLSANNIEDVLSAADTLGIDNLKKICFDFVEGNLTTDNALGYLMLANKYQQMTLYSKCQKKVAVDFQKLSTLTVLKTTSEEMMKVILSSDNLKVTSEVEVCEMLINWLKVRTEAGHAGHPEHLLPLIRWSGVGVDYIKARLLQNTTLMSNPACMTFLSKTISYLLTSVQFEGLQTFHRQSTGLENCLVVVGLHNGYSTTTEAYRISLQQPNHVSSLNNIPTTKMHCGSQACILNNVIYVTGIQETAKGRYGTWRFDVVSGWFKCADMMNERQYHCNTIVDSKLYVLGGSCKVDNTLTVMDSVECYNITRNGWDPAGDLRIAVSHAACVTYMNTIYVFGGQSNRKKSHVSHVQMYNPAAATVKARCTLMDQQMPMALGGLHAVLWETSAILMQCRTCFVYNFETQTWLARNQFKTDVCRFGLADDNQTIYIAGGGTFVFDKDNKKIWTCTDEIKSVNVLDILQDRTPVVWKHHAKLPKPCIIDAACRAVLVSH